MQDHDGFAAYGRAGWPALRTGSTPAGRNRGVLPSGRARAAPLRHRCHRPVPLRPGRGRSRPDADHPGASASSRRSPRAIRRPTQPPRRQPRAVRGAEHRARPRPHVRRRHGGPRRATPGSGCATASRAPRPPGTSPSSPTAASRSATRREPLYALLRRAYELLDAGMAPGRVARWYEMHLADELGQRPEVDRCVECDRMLEADRDVPLGPAAGRRGLRALPGPPADRTGLSLEALKLLKAYQRLDIEAIAALRLAGGGRARGRGGDARLHAGRARARPALARVPGRGPIGPRPRPARV